MIRPDGWELKKEWTGSAIEPVCGVDYDIFLDHRNDAQSSGLYRYYAFGCDDVNVTFSNNVNIAGFDHATAPPTITVTAKSVGR